MLAEGFGYKNYASLEAGLSRETNSSPTIYPLSFFLITLVIFIIGSANYFLSMLASIKDPHDFVDFVDLCSVANISVIIFNEKLRGHYIHGKSPCGSADVASQKLRMNLITEANGNAMVRGIAPSLPES